MQVRGIAFDEVLVPFGVEGQFNKFKEFSPTSKVPCLEADGLLIWDSLAICEYLAETYSGCWPVDSAARAWARSAAAEMHSGFQALRSQCPMNCGIRVTLQKIDGTLRADVDRIDALWQDGLTRFGGPYLAGKEYGIIDAFFAPVIFRAQSYGLRLSQSSQSYVDRLLSLPSMQRWYTDALIETWRKPEYEQAAVANGIIAHDFRV
ncbi:MAG: glutathione S-transferase [Alcaligenaceae bacterium]|nr:glutathione S-transferase [Alcaligenaceae bacterium]